MPTPKHSALCTSIKLGTNLQLKYTLILPKTQQNIYRENKYISSPRFLFKQWQFSRKSQVRPGITGVSRGTLL